MLQFQANDQENAKIVMHCHHNHFSSFDLFVDTAEGWELDFAQLTTSTGPSELLQVAAPNMLYSRAKFFADFFQRGGPNTGHRTFAFPALDCSQLTWCGEIISPSSLMVFPKDGEFESISRSGFHILTIAIDSAFLEMCANLFFNQALSNFMGSSGNVVHCNPALVPRLRDAFQRVDCLYMQEQPNANSASALENVSIQILRCLENSPTKSKRTKLSKRKRALTRTVELIDQSDIKISIADLVAQSGVSLRTLEYAFQEHFALTPLQYAKRLRLHRVHRQLCANTNGTSIDEAARKNGFTHRGQFANDYFSIYGELPSQTVKRRRLKISQ